MDRGGSLPRAGEAATWVICRSAARYPDKGLISPKQGSYFWMVTVVNRCGLTLD